MKQYLIIYILVFICMKGVLLQGNGTAPVSNATSETDPTAASANVTASTTIPVVANVTLETSPTPVAASPETSPLTSSSTVPVPVSTTTLASTESPPPPSPEETPATPTRISSHQFHAPSFIGGIVLALGLMAISYVGFKYYKSRTGRNYHTLQENLHM